MSQLEINAADTTDIRLVFLSIAISIVGSYTALGLAAQIAPSEGQTQPCWSIGSGLVLGISIWATHFTAILSRRITPPFSYDFKVVLISLGVAAVGSGFGLWTITRQKAVGWSLLVGGVLVSTGTVGMHYTAMSAVRFEFTLQGVSQSAVTHEWRLLTVISIAALLILTLALLASLFGQRLSAELSRIETLRQSEERLEQLVQQMTQELQEEKLISEAANQAKTTFLANMSHELRTPLTSIIGFSGVLLQEAFGPINDRQREYLQHISTGGYHLLDLINDLLDLSKIEADQEELVLETVTIKEICETCLSIVGEQAVRRKLNLSFTVSPDVSTCLVDKRRLFQILLNLLSNAIKFTDTGSVTLAVARTNTTIQFLVTDTGIGILEVEQSKLFQPFQQLDNGLDRQYQGTGLGLALSQRLAQLHGGEITVKSAPEQGSCFILSLPWVAAA